MAKNDALSKLTRVWIASHLTPSAQSAVFAKIVKEDVAKLIDSGRASPIYTRYVDGVKGAAEETVKPTGSITYIFDFMTDVIPEAIKFLRANSPVLTGRYRDSFYISVGNTRVLAQDFDPKLVLGETEVYIYNFVPYSRKVDVQLIGYKPIYFNGGYHIFENCAQRLKSRFGNTITVKRLYDIAFPGKYKLRQTQMRPSPRSHLILRSRGSLVESPGLYITTHGG